MGIYNHEFREAKWKTYDGPPPKLPAPSFRMSEVARDYLIDRGLNPRLAGHNGWYPADMDVPRLVIPCTNSAGTAYWQARAMDEKTKMRYDSPSAPRGDSVVVVHPQHLLKGRAVVVEGPMDALASAAFGYLGIATMGNNPAHEALELIVAKFGATHTPFIIIPDKDDEAFGAKLVAAFATLGAASVVALLSEGKDICELNPGQRERFFKKLKGNHVHKTK